MYKEIWEAGCGQAFSCLQEVGNAYNPFAVYVMRDSEVIDHVGASSYVYVESKHNHKIHKNLNPSKLNTLTISIMVLSNILVV